MSFDRTVYDNAQRTCMAQARGFAVVLDLQAGGSTRPGRVVERDGFRVRHNGTTVAVRLEPGGWTHLGDVAQVRSAR